MVRVLKILSSNELLIGLTVYVSGYTAIRFLGVFGPSPEGIMKIFHAFPVILALSVLIANMVLRLGQKVFNYSGKSNDKFTIVFCTGITLIATGIILSSFTRFEGSIVLTEGQVFSSDTDSYLENSVYLRRLSASPNLKLEMVQVFPVISKNGKGLWFVKAGLNYLNHMTGKSKNININSILPSFEGGALYSIVNFGYSPRYRFTSASGAVIEGAYYMVKIFPPGAEDSFRLLEMPETFYLRYYPDSSMVKDSKFPVGKTGPVYYLRIARNLDVVFNGYISPHEKANMGSMFISFEDIRKWVEIKIVKDYGLYLIMPGVLMAVISGFWHFLKRNNFMGVEDR